MVNKDVSTRWSDALIEMNLINTDLAAHVKTYSELMSPDSISFVKGTESEYNSLIGKMLSESKLIALNKKEYKDCYLYRSDPNDVARTEKDTFVCTKNRDDAGPTNNWMEPGDAKRKLNAILKNSMKGRALYVVPYHLGPEDSVFSRLGVELTDSVYVVLNLMKLTHMGAQAIDLLRKHVRFVLGVNDTANLDKNNKYICHFPEDPIPLIISVNTEYGGNAILSKKCHSLRIASYEAQREGWVAEHMGCIGVKEPSGDVTYISFGFPSQSGKTNMAMIRPPHDYEDWSTQLISDDIVWMRPSDGALRGVNPEAGFFAVAPGTSEKTNPGAMEALMSNTIFTNVGLTRDKKPWWEGMGKRPEHLLNWLGEECKPDEKAAHPNSRYTTPLQQYAGLSPKYYDRTGVPISAMLFGGRRSTIIPLIYEAYSWEHGILIGAMQRVETTAAATGKVGVIRNDPMAMIPFCGYNMSDYFAHLLSFGRLENKPRIYSINAFRKDSEGNFMWPGFCDNMRVLHWIIDRKKGVKDNAMETPLGFMPSMDSLDRGSVDKETMEKLFKIDKRGWLNELLEVRTFFESFGNRFPKRLWDEYHALEQRLNEW